MAKPTLLFRILFPSFLAITLIGLYAFGNAVAQDAALPPNSDLPSAVLGKQGDVLYVRLEITDEPLSVTGALRDRRVPFFRTSDTEFAALVGIDMADDPGLQDVTVDITSAHGRRQQALPIAIAAEDFREQRLTLPKEQVDPDADALKRIVLEREKIKSVFGSFTPERLWSKPFVVPVEGVPTGAFGRRRILNGQPRNQHSGEDIAAPLGTPVKATNDGIVTMVDDHFFSGTSIILDHGLGLYTMYSHLQTSKVKKGDRVDRGHIIGTVGKTGRATGPHLHWGVWLNGARVNPFSLIKLPIDNTP